MNLNTATPAPLPKAQWRRLAQLCHPDRHNNSVASTEAMKAGLAITRAELKFAEKRWHTGSPV